MTNGYLETAAELGRQIAGAAIWSGRRCSWVGGMPEESPDGFAMSYLSFGPELYGGTAGVGLALAEVHAASGEPELRRTALGALEHALAHIASVHDSVRLGIYSGVLGIAVAAVRAGHVLADESLVERGFELTGNLHLRAAPLENDLLLGRAGGIVALLVLHRSGGAEALLERAVEIGDDLLDAADVGETMSWGSPSFPEQPNLTGLSHGAAGIALALLELHAATGQERFRAAADAGFAYERTLYDPLAGNWPDLRELATRGREPGAPPSYPVLWCHGAPGIALSRLRAYELVADTVYRDEAIAALDTTLRSVRAELATGNYSLCHGLAGNAEVVGEGSGLLGDEAAKLHYAVAAAGIDTYGASGQWPGGVFDGMTDSLLLGRAGTAYFYLRLHDPSVPSVLLFRPERFA